MQAGRRHREVERHTTRVRFVLAFVALLSAGMATLGVQLIAHDVELERARTELIFWQDAAYSPSTAAITALDHQLSSLVDAWRVHPDTWVLLANRASWQRFWALESGALSEAEGSAGEAVRLQQMALNARPTHTPTQQTLKRYEADLRALDETSLVPSYVDQLFRTDDDEDSALEGLPAPAIKALRDNEG
ncbi:MAG: hypothetical protein VYE04_15120 [Pseudomonadota bacterium]|nr:hypothetical protein [Pseudomonadota bacterium]